MKYNLKEQAAILLKNSTGFEDHHLPASRRDFVKMGLIAGGGYLLPSSVLANLPSNMASSPSIPFMVFDLAGGAGLPANFLVGQKGGPDDLCKDYKKHGWNPRENNSMDRIFGIPMSKQNSQILNGLRSTLPPDVLNQSEKVFLQMASICNFSLDDSPDNRSSALSLVSKSGLVGKYLKNGLGQRSSLSGGNSDVVLQDPQLQPKLVTSIDDILNLTSLGNRFLELSPNTKEIIRKKLKIAGQNFPGLHQAYKDLAQFGDLHKKGDPTQSVEIATAYNLNDNTVPETIVQAGISYNVLQGYTGPGVVTIGNCDYHDNTQTTGDNKDLEIGVAIGRAIHSAHLLKKPLFFQILTDGGVYAPGSDNYDRIWQGDANLHSLTIIGFYDPTGSIKMRKYQIGHYTPGAEVEMSTFVGKKPENMVTSVMANYLYLNGLLGHFENLTGLRMRASEIDELLAFA